LKVSIEGRNLKITLSEEALKNRLRGPQSVKISLHREGMISNESMEDLKAAKIAKSGDKNLALHIIRGD